MGAHRVIRFKQADITRAAKGLQLAGINSAEITIDQKGIIRIIIGPSVPPVAGANEWDEVLR